MNPPPAQGPGGDETSAVERPPLNLSHLHDIKLSHKLKPNAGSTAYGSSRASHSNTCSGTSQDVFGEH